MLALGFPNPDPVIQTRVSGLENGKPGFRVRISGLQYSHHIKSLADPDTVSLRHHKQVEFCRGRGLPK